MFRTFQAALRWATRNRKKLKRWRKPRGLVLTAEQQKAATVEWANLVERFNAYKANVERTGNESH